MKIVLYIIMLLCGGMLFSSASAQSVQQVEQEIQNHLQRIQYWKFEYSPEDTSFKTKVNPDDSLLNANIQLVNYLLNIGKKQPASLKSKITLPENSDMLIVSSDDGMVRIYSWNTHIQTHPFATIIQYESAAQVKTMALFDYKSKDTKTVLPIPEGKSYKNIVNITANNGRKYYLLISSRPTSDNNVEKEIEAKVIADMGLQPVNVFESTANMKYEYNYSSNYDFRKMKEEYDVRYEKGKLYVPEVSDYKMIGKYRIYNFDGIKFVLDTIK